MSTVALTQRYGAEWQLRTCHMLHDRNCRFSQIRP